mgnify:CR=1 FL=1
MGWMRAYQHVSKATQIQTLTYAQTKHDDFFEVLLVGDSFASRPWHIIIVDSLPPHARMRNIPAAQARRFDRFRCFSRRGLFNIHHIAVMAVCAGTEPRPINIAPIAKIMLRFITRTCPIADLIPFKTGCAQ